MSDAFWVTFGLYVFSMILLGWIFVANVVLRRRMKLSDAGSQMFYVVMWMLILTSIIWENIKRLWLFPVPTMWDWERTKTFIYIAFIISMWWLRYWLNQKVVYGFVHARDVLLLRQPVDPIQQLINPYKNKGVFVPRASTQDLNNSQSGVFLAALLIALGITMLLLRYL